MVAEATKTIVVVTDEQRFTTLHWPTERSVLRVDGGTERYDSVLAGLRAAPESATHVAVHDGARPLAHPEAITTCITTARQTGAAALARRVTETLKRADGDNRATESVPRDDLWIMETPQVFEISLLRRAYDEVLAQQLPVTDDVSAAEAIGQSTQLVENPFPNPKITVPADLPLAEALLKTA